MSPTYLTTTQNGGKEWNRTLRSISWDNKIYLTTRYRGWAIVSDSLYQTQNGGKSWAKVESESLPSPQLEWLYNLIFIDANEGWILTYVFKTGEGRLYQTVDGGKNWELKETISVTRPFGTFCYDGKKSIYLAIAEGGAIYQYTDESYSSRGRRVKGGLPVEILGKRATMWGDVKRSVLYQNYPNPFNPETWIPYQLASDANVSISIYDIHGNLVRLLRIGQQPAGVYMTKSEAAYWDGLNNFGEPVASGICFYSLQTEAFATTRKLIILK